MWKKIIIDNISINDINIENDRTRNLKSIVDELKQKASKAESVFLATDPDREGEAISWHLQNVLGLKALINEIIFWVGFKIITRLFSSEDILVPVILSIILKALSISGSFLTAFLILSIVVT